MENVKTVVRVRQILCMERKVGDVSCVEVHDCGKKLDVKILPTKTEVYKCSKVFPRLTHQHAFYEQCGVLDLIDRAIGGNSVNILAFGEHNSGKSYTLFGPPKSLGACEKNIGLITRSLKYIFKKLDDLDTKYNLSLTCVEILDEQILDLCVPEGTRTELSLERGPTGNISVHGVHHITCTTYTSAAVVVDSIVGERCRAQPNAHCVFEVHIDLPVEDESSSDKAKSKISLGKISFVDLADSEYLSARTSEEGSVVHADHSLTVLSKTIDGLEKINNDNATVMDSPLTALLYDSIGVSGCSLLIACIYEGTLSVAETVKTLQFSCVHMPKMLKYYDAKAKVAYDLQIKLRLLNRQNRKLRNTILAAPTWELHALATTTPSAKKQEQEQDKALLAMHNEILKANVTYKFKPRGGGRMFFPSPVSGREIPMKPKQYFPEKSVLQSGGYLENSSLQSMPCGLGPEEGEVFDEEPSRACSRGDYSRGASRGGGSREGSSGKSKKDFTVSVATMDDIVRKCGATGPIVFRNKHATRGEPGSSQDVPAIEPLRDTTRLGFNREGKDWPQEDWPKEIRQRIASMDSAEAVHSQPRDPKLEAKEPLFTWTPEPSVESPFVAHLIAKPKKALPKVPISTRLTPAEETSFKFRPHTAPISEIAGRVQQETEKRSKSDRQILRTSSVDSPIRPANNGTGAGIGLRARTSSEIKLPVPERKSNSVREDGIHTDSSAVGSLDDSVLPPAEPAAEVAVAKKKRVKTSAGTSRSSSASSTRPVSALSAEYSRPSSAARPLSALVQPISVARPVSGASSAAVMRSPSGIRPQSAAEAISPSSTTNAALTPPPGSHNNTRPSSADLTASSSDSSGAFNPLRPSVFAASLMSDQSTLARRQSALATMDNFNTLFNVPEESRLAPVLEEREKSGKNLPPAGSRSQPMGHKHGPNGKKLEKSDSFRDSCGVSLLSSKSNSFSSLPSVDLAPPRMKQKSASMRMFS